MPDESPRAKLLALAQAALAELRALQDGKPRPPEWGTFISSAGFPFIIHLKELAGAALDAGAPALYERLRKLAEKPYCRPERRWLLIEMIASVAELALWCRQAPSPLPAPAGSGTEGEGAVPPPPPAASPLPPTASRPPPASNPGRRLRGGREIMEAIEGAYSYARWRAFRREALKHGAPVEWPEGGGQPRAWENPLKSWVAARLEAAEAAREEREARDSQIELDRKTGRQAYTGGDDQPLRVIKHPGGRRGR